MSATNQQQETAEDLEFRKRLEENSDPNWNTPEYRAARMVWEPDDVTVTPPGPDDWSLTLTDGSAFTLVQTPEQLDLWLDAQGVSLDDLKQTPMWQNAPAAIREALD